MVYLSRGNIPMTEKQKKSIKRKLSRISIKVATDIERYSNGRLAKGINTDTLCKTTK